MLTKANTSVSRSGYKFRYQILPETGMSDACGCGNQVEKWKEWKKIAWFTTVHVSGYMGNVPWQMACCVILSSCFRLLSEGHLLKSVASFAGDGEESMKPQNRQCFQQLIMFFFKKTFLISTRNLQRKKLPWHGLGGEKFEFCCNWCFGCRKILSFWKARPARKNSGCGTLEKKGRKAGCSREKRLSLSLRRRKFDPIQCTSTNEDVYYLIQRHW